MYNTNRRHSDHGKYHNARPRHSYHSYREYQPRSELNRPYYSRSRDQHHCERREHHPRIDHRNYHYLSKDHKQSDYASGSHSGYHYRGEEYSDYDYYHLNQNYPTQSYNEPHQQGDESTEPVKFAVLSDSILKYCKIPGRIDLIAKKGADIVELIYQQRCGKLFNWKDYNVVLIHAGTNDIASGDGKLIHKRMQTLTDSIKRINPRIDIIISSILPRPCNLLHAEKSSRKEQGKSREERQSVNDQIKSVNQVLKIWCKQTQGLHFWPSFKQFVSFGVINQEEGLFAIDDLHLSRAGTDKIREHIDKLVTDYYLGRVPFSAE